MSTLNYRPIDADQHYYEPDDCFSRHISSKFSDRVIHTVPTKEPGIGAWCLGDRLLSTGLAPENAADRSPAPGSFEDLFSGKATVEQTQGNLCRPKDDASMMNRAARLIRMDEQGIEAAIMLPTFGLHIGHVFGADTEALAANLTSYNRWLEEDWGYGAAGRIYGVPMISLRNLNFAVTETQRVAARGAKFVYVWTGPVDNRRSPADPFFDPFWRTVEETGIKVIFHTDFTNFNELYAKYWSEDPNRTVYEYSPLQIYYSVLERPISDTMAAVLLHNLFGRFPKLQVLTIELGSSWIRPLLRVLDKAVKFGAKGKWLGGSFDALPSEIFPQHVSVSPYFEEDVEDLIDLIGVDRVLFGSDYPHPEGLKDPLSYTHKSLAGLPDSVVRKIMRDNTAALLGI